MIVSFLIATPIWASLAADGENWPAFRGANAMGVAEGHATPSEWKEAKWRTPIPGLAHSSPVVWEDSIFVTTAQRVTGDSELSSLFGSPGYGAGESVENEGPHHFKLYCLDKADGSIRWERTAHTGIPKVKRHPKSSHANPTPACDAEVVVAFFGSEGLHAFDHAGELLWKHDFGVLDAGAPGISTPEDYQWGFASSPILHGGKVIVQCDVQGQSFVAALDKLSGEVLWRTDREEDPTWCTPSINAGGAGGRPQVVLNGYRHIAGYDLETGEEVWNLSGGGDVPVPTPVVAYDLVFLTSAHGRERPIRAIRADAEGALENDPDHEHIEWIEQRRGVYMQTPLVHDGILYACSDAGVLAAHDAFTGEMLYRERVGDGSTGFSGSPVYADGKLYLSAEAGEVVVVRAGPEFELLATNDLGETLMATPAISEGTLFFRTRGQLIAVGK